jgi:hypothetical protein
MDALMTAANNLGADLQRFGEEAHKLAGHKAAVRAAQVRGQRVYLGYLWLWGLVLAVTWGVSPPLDAMVCVEAERQL